MNQKDLVTVVFLLEQRRVIEPMRDQSSLTATLISRDDQRLVLHLNLMLLLRGLGLLSAFCSWLV
jgi:hypothetical protein